MSIILFVYRARYRVRVCPLTIGGGVGGHWYADFKEISSGTLGQPPKQDLRVNSACLNQYSIFKNSKKSSNAAIVNDYFGKIIDVITHSFFRYIVCIWYLAMVLRVTAGRPIYIYSLCAHYSKDNHMRRNREGVPKGSYTDNTRLSHPPPPLIWQRNT